MSSRPCVGINYNGEPSAPAGGGVSWIKRLPNGEWIDPSGMRRSETGELVTSNAAPRPIGPERDHRHDMNVRLLDNMIERDAANRPDHDYRSTL